MPSSGSVERGASVRRSLPVATSTITVSLSEPSIGTANIAPSGENVASQPVVSAGRRELLAPDEVEYGDLAALAGDDKRLVVSCEADGPTSDRRKASVRSAPDLLARLSVRTPDRPRETHGAHHDPSPLKATRNWLASRGAAERLARSDVDDHERRPGHTPDAEPRPGLVQRDDCWPWECHRRSYRLPGRASTQGHDHRPVPGLDGQPPAVAAEREESAGGLSIVRQHRFVAEVDEPYPGGLYRPRSVDGFGRGRYRDRRNPDHGRPSPSLTSTWTAPSVAPRKNLGAVQAEERYRRPKVQDLRKSPVQSPTVRHSRKIAPLARSTCTTHASVGRSSGHARAIGADLGKSVRRGLRVHCADEGRVGEQGDLRGNPMCRHLDVVDRPRGRGAEPGRDSTRRVTRSAWESADGRLRVSVRASSGWLGFSLVRRLRSGVCATAYRWARAIAGDRAPTSAHSRRRRVGGAAEWCAVLSPRGVPRRSTAATKSRSSVERRAGSRRPTRKPLRGARRAAGRPPRGRPAPTLRSPPRLGA